MNCPLIGSLSSSTPTVNNQSEGSSKQLLYELNFEDPNSQHMYYGTPPLTRFSYSSVFYLTRFFEHQNSVIFLYKAVFSWPKPKKMSKIFFQIFFPFFFISFFNCYFLFLFPIIFSQALIEYSRKYILVFKNISIMVTQ